MKRTFTALALALTLALVPAASMAYGLSSLTPNLTFPEKDPATVTRGIFAPVHPKPAPRTFDVER